MSLLLPAALWQYAHFVVFQLVLFTCSYSLFESFLFLLFPFPLLSSIFCLMLILQLISLTLSLDFSVSSSAASSTILLILPVLVLMLLLLLLLLFIFSSFFFCLLGTNWKIYTIIQLPEISSSCFCYIVTSK